MEYGSRQGLKNFFLGFPFYFLFFFLFLPASFMQALGEGWERGENCKQAPHPGQSMTQGLISQP